MELYERKELAKIKKEYEEIEKTYDAVKNLSNGRLEPFFV